MKKIVYIATSLFIIPTFFLHAYTFTQTMSLGSASQDVLELQKILNSNSQTKIAETGVGSSGNETIYFGEKTKNAVMRFQNLHAKEILYPNNVTEGTGFVGQSTLSFLNTYTTQTQNTSSVSTSSTEIQNIIQQAVSNSNIENNISTSTNQFFVSKTTVKPKEKIYIGSDHDLKNIDFYLDSYKMRKTCRHSAHTCSFKVFSKPGTYTLKSSEAKIGSHSITVVDRHTHDPEPFVKKLSLTEDNLIQGRNFSKNIKIFTMFGVFESETLNNSFVLTFPESYISNATTTIEGLFFIENENGLQSEPKIIQYEI